MKKTAIIVAAVLFFSTAGAAGYLSIPFTISKNNQFHKQLNQSDYDSQNTMNRLTEIMDKNEADSLFIMEGQNVLAEYGESDQISNVASVRKSLISALFGIAESKGLINVNRTLGDLGIDDTKNPLSEKEKQATVEDLLKARSGIYITSLGESKDMKEKRPERGTYSHNEHYYYNNWDFNTLGVIFEQETGTSLGEAFYEWIAKPTEMKKFQPSNVVYQESEETSMPMYRFYMCAEDLARFGSLYANDGKWKDKQVIPEKWIDASFEAYSEITDVDRFTGYGYLWWLEKQKDQTLQWAVGAGGQYVVVDRESKISLAMMNNTGTSPLGVFWYRTFDGGEEPYADVRDVFELAKNSIMKRQK